MKVIKLSGKPLRLIEATTTQWWCLHQVCRYSEQVIWPRWTQVLEFKGKKIDGEAGWTQSPCGKHSRNKVWITLLTGITCSISKNGNKVVQIWTEQAAGFNCYLFYS